MERFQYLAVLGLCVLVTLPLEFCFQARVWRRPRRLALAVLPMFLVFVAWDIWATSRGTWSFDPDYTVGLELPGGLVIEELLFFVIVPACALLTLESVRNVMSGRLAWLPWVARR